MANTQENSNSSPTYLELVKAAIVSQKSRTGASLPSIKKYVTAAKGDVYMNGWLLRALKTGVKEGDLVQIKGSYKLSAKAKKKAAPKKKPAPKKKAAPKKKPAPKKKVTTKKAEPAPKKGAPQ